MATDHLSVQQHPNQMAFFQLFNWWS